jgi:hypothetical protein
VVGYVYDRCVSKVRWSCSSFISLFTITTCFCFYSAANRSDFFVRGWSAPNTVRRMPAASMNICFASLFFHIARKTIPMSRLPVCPPRTAVPRREFSIGDAYIRIAKRRRGGLCRRGRDAARGLAVPKALGPRAIAPPRFQSVSRLTCPSSWL